MEFRKALLYKAGPTVFGIIASTPKDISDLELKQIILQNFSDIATPSEAAQKLRTMQMKTDQPIRSHNYYFTAVHEAAFGIKARRSENEVCVLRTMLTLYQNSQQIS